MIEWLKNKLKKWLGINKIEKEIKMLFEDISYCEDSISVLHKTIENICHIEIDVD